MDRSHRFNWWSTGSDFFVRCNYSRLNFRRRCSSASLSSVYGLNRFKWWSAGSYFFVRCNYSRLNLRRRHSSSALLSSMRFRSIFRLSFPPRICCVSVANDRLAVCIQCPAECSQSGVSTVVKNVLDCSRKRSNAFSSSKLLERQRPSLP